MGEGGKAIGGEKAGGHKLVGGRFMGIKTGRGDMYPGPKSYERITWVTCEKHKRE